jgi:hypothetical protein
MISLGLGILFDYLFYDKIPGISFPLYILLVIAGLFIIARITQKQINKEVFTPIVLLVFFSTMIFVRSNDLLVFLDIVTSLILLLVIAEISFFSKMKKLSLQDFLKIFFLPFKFFQPAFQTLSNIFLLRGAKEDRKILSQILRGIIMTIPALFVFLLLFSSADLIFQKYVSEILSIENEMELFLRFLLILIVTIVFIGAYTYSFREKGETIMPQSSNKHAVEQIESSIILGSINILFSIFIIVQFTYLFGGESNISAQGFTYAEYARRGFFELIAVAVISLFLLLITEKYAIKKEAEHTLSFKILSTALITQVILIMVSAFIRLSLYEEAYGFTTLRLYSHAFIILLAFIFCLLFYKIFQDDRESAFILRVLISIAFFLAFMNLLNPDAFIARRNIERFERIGKIDIDYLGSLSDDAMPIIINVLDIPDEDMRKSLSLILYQHTQNRDSFYYSQWQSLNLSRIRANGILKSKSYKLEAYKNLQ